MALLTVEHLCLGYEGRELVHDLNFTVENGDYLAILGENGSGKSTLMRTLLGLQAPLSGRITFGEGFAQTQIGYLPQQTAAQKDFPASVWEVVLSGCQSACGIRPFYSAAQKETAKAQIEKMGLSALIHRCYRELSGGQQQRVLLARALCATHKMLLLDEPVSGLDPKATEEMYALVAALNREGIAVLMISHDLAGVLPAADKVLSIGHTLFCGSKEAFLAKKEAESWN